jgi:uncharacterized protein (DUF2147 family)
MKTLLFATALVLSAGQAVADPIEGLWKTQPDDNGKFGYVQIAACGAKICGVLVKAFESSGAETPSDNIGKQIVWDMSPSGAGTYGGGKVWAPDRNKTYKGKMQLSGDDLAVSGCVLGGMICRDSDWKRVK